MDELLIRNSRRYAEQTGRKLSERLGSGIHGMVHVLSSNVNNDRSALKVFRERESFERERNAYLRLRKARIRNIDKFNVPLFLCDDAKLMAIEMTIVVRPFVLDFAGAWLDSPPEFSRDTWEFWEREKREQFGNKRWRIVQEVLSSLRMLGIFMIDVKPDNVAFQD